MEVVRYLHPEATEIKSQVQSSLKTELGLHIHFGGWLENYVNDDRKAYHSAFKIPQI